MTTATLATFQTIDATDVRPGDAIMFLGESYYVDRIEPYIGPYESLISGVARSGPFWGMCLEAGSLLDVLRAVET